MINILEILKKIPNLEDMVFYSPLYGNVKVAIFENNDYPIELYTPNGYILNENSLNCLSKEGYFDNFSYGEREPMLYPSRQNRDWSTFKIPRKDLLENTPVLYCSDPRIGWHIGKYKSNTAVKSIPINTDISEVKWEYIVPVDKFNFDNWTFQEEDNYGTEHIDN